MRQSNLTRTPVYPMLPGATTPAGVTFGVSFSSHFERFVPPADVLPALKRRSPPRAASGAAP